jgi:hypothetical protein
MADDQSVGPIVTAGELGAEAGGTGNDRILRFLFRGPPDILDRREIVVRPVPFQRSARGADIAGEGVPFAHERIDGYLQAQRGGDRADGLQCPCVRRDYDALDALADELLGSFLCLGVTELGQARIDDAGIAPCGTKVQVELALAVAQQDHRFVVRKIIGRPYRGMDRSASAFVAPPRDDLAPDSFVIPHKRAYLLSHKEGVA